VRLHRTFPLEPFIDCDDGWADGSRRPIQEAVLLRPKTDLMNCFREE